MIQTPPTIRTAFFNRNRFNLCELHAWSRRTGARVIRCTYSAQKARVTYR